MSDIAKDVVIVGAGAAGLMAAVALVEEGIRPLLLDKNRAAGRKLRITGKGRCNLTNNSEPQEVIAAVVNNGRFLYGAINSFTPQMLMEYFESRGVKLKTERGKRVFPVSDSADEIADMLIDNVLSGGGSFKSSAVKRIVKQEHGFLLHTDTGEIETRQLLLACGGGSYPGTGSNGDGIRLAKSLGHSVKRHKPSLVPLVEDGTDCARLQGLSLRNCSITVVDKNTGKKRYQDFGELLFTHFGLSGPVILSASAHMTDMDKSDYRVIIDLKPALDDKKLDARILRDFLENKNKAFSNVLDGLLPKKMVELVAERAGIAGETKCNEISREQRAALREVLKAFEVKVKGFRPLAEAIVSSGGVEVNEINPKSMESKLLPGLYMAGEMLDVDAYTGGFNLQIAFSTGYLAGKAMAKAISRTT